jgi:hypothetical protein
LSFSFRNSKVNSFQLVYAAWLAFPFALAGTSLQMSAQYLSLSPHDKKQRREEEKSMLFSLSPLL